MAYEVVSYREDLHEDAAALHARLAACGPELSSAYLRWKYERNPYLPEPLVYLVLADGRPVGMRGAYGTCWRIGGGVRVLPCFGDTIVVPEHRNRQLFPLLMRFALADLARRGYPYALNLSAEPITVMSSLATGWRAPGRPVVLRRRSRFELACRRGRSGSPARLVRRVRRRLRGGGRAFDRLDRARPGAPSLGEAVRLLDAPPGEGRVRHVRDAEFLAWRFQDPRMEHRVVLPRAGAGAGGCLVLKAPVGDRRVILADWAAPSPDTLPGLVREALDDGRFPELTVWAGALGEETQAALRAAGFSAVDYGLRVSLLVRATDDRPAGDGWTLDGVDLLDPDAWEVRLLHSERELV